MSYPQWGFSWKALWKIAFLFTVEITISTCWVAFCLSLPAPQIFTFQFHECWVLFQCHIPSAWQKIRRRLSAGISGVNEWINEEDTYPLTFLYLHGIMGGKLGTDIPVRCCFGYFVMYLFCSFARCFRNLVEIAVSSSDYRGNSILQYTVFFIVHMCIIARLPKLKCSKADKNAPRPQWNGGLGFLFACLFVFHIYTYICVYIYILHFTAKTCQIINCRFSHRQSCML